MSVRMSIMSRIIFSCHCQCSKQHSADTFMGNIAALMTEMLKKQSGWFPSRSNIQ